MPSDWNDAFRSLVLLALLLTAGCSESRPTCYPVHGQVTQNKKQLAEAIVVLHPQGRSPTAQKPLAHTDADGRFQVTTFAPGDGAPPGSYAVTIELRAPRQAGEEIIRDGRNLLPARYANPATSDFTVDVKEGENEIPAIDLPLK